MPDESTVDNTVLHTTCSHICVSFPAWLVPDFPPWLYAVSSGEFGPCFLLLKWCSIFKTFPTCHFWWDSLIQHPSPGSTGLGPDSCSQQSEHKQLLQLWYCHGSNATGFSWQQSTFAEAFRERETIALCLVQEKKHLAWSLFPFSLAWWLVAQPCCLRALHLTHVKLGSFATCDCKHCAPGASAFHSISSKGDIPTMPPASYANDSCLPSIG